MTAPERSIAQRRAALLYANEVRSFRAALKVKIAAAEIDADTVLVSRDPRLDSMRVEGLVLAVPGMGRVKCNMLFRKLGISPSKTVAGISPRQRGQLLVALRSHRSRSNLYAARKAVGS